MCCAVEGVFAGLQGHHKGVCTTAYNDERLCGLIGVVADTLHGHLVGSGLFATLVGQRVVRVLGQYHLAVLYGYARLLYRTVVVEYRRCQCHHTAGQRLRHDDKRGFCRAREVVLTGHRHGYCAYVDVWRYAGGIAGCRNYQCADGYLTYSWVLGLSVVDVAGHLVKHDIGVVQAERRDAELLGHRSCIVALTCDDNIVGADVHATFVGDIIVVRCQEVMVTDRHTRALLYTVVGKLTGAQRHHVAGQRLGRDEEGLVDGTLVVALTPDGDCSHTYVDVVYVHDRVVCTLVQGHIALLHRDGRLLLATGIYHAFRAEGYHKAACFLGNDVIRLRSRTRIVTLSGDRHVILAYVDTAIVRQRIVRVQRQRCLTLFHGNLRLLQLTRVDVFRVAEQNHVTRDFLLSNREVNGLGAREVALTGNGDACRTCDNVSTVAYIIACRRNDVVVDKYLAHAGVLGSSVIDIARQLVQVDVGLGNAERRNRVFCLGDIGNGAFIVALSDDGDIVRTLIHITAVDDCVIIGFHDSSVGHGNVRTLQTSVKCEGAWRH